MTSTKVPGFQILNFVQDVPTPHNNDLLKALQAVDHLTVRAWYFRSSLSEYGFRSDLASTVVTPDLYNNFSGSARMLLRAFGRRSEQWLLVHWSNPTTKVFLVLSWALRRKFNIWLDMPAEPKRGRRTRRDLAQWVLRHSRARIFCVGRMTVDYFLDRGFSKDALVNLPVVMSGSASGEEIPRRATAFRVKHGIPVDCFLIATGSRLVREKGFDVLVTAMARLSANRQGQILAVIVGQGEEAGPLRTQVEWLNVRDRVQFWPWLEADEFRDLFAAADLIVHPARWDAYGGPALIALAEGKPLVGTRQAGGSVDIVDEGVNGLLYEAEEADTLAKIIEALADSPKELERLGAGMVELRASAARTPEGAADLLTRKLI